MSKFIVFIVGVGRSGTSLLQSMLASHEYLSFPPETSFLRRMIATGIIDKAIKNTSEKKIITILNSDKLIKRTGLHARDLIKLVKKKETSLTGVGIYKAFLKLYANLANKPFCGDKDPRAIEYMELIKAIFPEIHVINIIRDPRDVLASKKKARWSRSGHIWKHVFANRVQIRLGRKIGLQKIKENYHEILYEDLISYPEKILSDLCKELSIHFDSNMLTFNKAAKVLVTESEMSWKKETLGPLLPDNKEKWRKSLLPKEILITEDCCREAMVRGSYKPDERLHNLSLHDRIWIFTGQLIIKLATWPYIVIRRIRIKWVCWRVL